MLNTNLVVFKGRKEGITIVLDDGVGFDELRDIFIEKMADARKFFGGGKTSIIFKGRKLTEEQETELLQIIASEANVNISFFRNAQPEEPRREPTAVSPKVRSAHREESTAKLNSYEQRTIFNTGALRSGQAINYSGTVVVMGDINPGAKVTATGNIIVMGAAKGFVHAGSAGDTSCFVFATELAPVQLRIADIITVIPKDEASEKKFFKSRKKTAPPSPSMAYITGGQIYISQI